MTAAVAKVRFSLLPAAQQLRFLVRLATEVTIVARASYPQLVGEAEAAGKLASLNRVQRRLSDEILAMVSEGGNVSRDASLIDALRANAGEQCDRELDWALRSVSERT